jgi:hypothetical protein
MRLLFFFSHIEINNYKPTINFLKNFIIENTSIHIIFEDYSNYKDFKENNHINKFIKINFIKNKNLNLSDFFLKYIMEKDIKYCIINIGLGVFQSKPIETLSQVLQKNNIKTFIPISNSPLNGMFSIYNNLKFDNNELNKYYDKNLYTEESWDIKLKVSEFIKNYKEYQENNLIQKNKFKNSSTSIYYSIKNNVINFTQRILYRYNSNKLSINNNNNNILLLLTKNDNHWITKYNNPELCNKLANIKKIIDKIPPNYNLIIKSHPRIKIEKDIEILVKNHKNIKIGYNEVNTFDLIKKSKIIIGYGTTSLILPLLLNKHVIEIGKESIFFRMSNPPVQKVDNFENIDDRINFCISNDVNKKKIFKYFQSIQQTNILFYKNNITHKVDDEAWALLAKVLIKKIYKY